MLRVITLPAGSLPTHCRARWSAWARLDYLAHLGLDRLHAEIGDCPGRTGLRPWIRVVAWRDVHDHVERVTGRARFANLACQLSERRRARQAGGEQAFPTQRPPHRSPVGPLRRHPHRDPRLLHRDRLELPGPVPDQIVETSVEQPSPLTWIGDLPERFEFAVSRAAEPNPEGKAARAAACSWRTPPPRVPPTDRPRPSPARGTRRGPRRRNRPSHAPPRRPRARPEPVGRPARQTVAHRSPASCAGA